MNTMRLLKDGYILFALVTMMIVRPFAPGEWFGTIVVVGLLISIWDLIGKVHNSCRSLASDKEKSRYAIMMVALFLVGLGLLVLAILNLIMNLPWLNAPVVLDEITLLTLLVSLNQGIILSLLNYFIMRKDG